MVDFQQERRPIAWHGTRTLARVARKKRAHAAPMALASDGTLILNLASVIETDQLDQVLAAAQATRGRLFVGVALGSSEASQVLGRLDEAAKESAAKLVGSRKRRR